MKTFESKEEELQSKLDAIVQILDDYSNKDFGSNVWLAFLINNIRSVIDE